MQTVCPISTHTPRCPCMTRALTDHLDIVENACCATGAHAVVGVAGIRARVSVTHSINQQVAEQEASVVLRA